MTENMSLFKIKKEKENKASKALTPIFLGSVIFIMMWSYANMIMEELVSTNYEIALLSLFVIATTFLTLFEGIYKSSSLLFNCKDDNLLLSLPIKKSTVLFIRILKFYVFELLYNSLFLVPAMVVYAQHVPVRIDYYITSFIAILLLPIIPIVISCIIGGIISKISSKFKFKNLVQIIVTTIILLIVMYFSFTADSMLESFGNKVIGIHETIIKLYYPAKLYTRLVVEFNLLDMIKLVGLNVIIFGLAIVVLSNSYFKINSKSKEVSIATKNTNYKIKTNKPVKSIIKKELNRFFNSPVFVVNAGFGLVLFVVISIAIAIKYDAIVQEFLESNSIQLEQIQSYMPVALFGLICFASFMSSITSSMISLEGKAFNILKSLPVKPFTIINAKVLTALTIMLPAILLGNMVFFIRFGFNILEILLILMSSIILPLVAETIGIIVNLKHPRMDAENDTEVVKQSMSSLIAVFSGFILIAITALVLIVLITSGLSPIMILLTGTGIYAIIYLLLLLVLKTKGEKMFNKINV